MALFTAYQITLFHLKLRFICLHVSKESIFGQESVGGINLLSNLTPVLLVYWSAEATSVIFLYDFGSFASFRPQVRKAIVTERYMRNANIFPCSFHFTSILVKKMIFRKNFFYYFVLKKVTLTLSVQKTCFE